MGAFRGSITFTKFHVRGELPKSFRDRFMKRIRLRAFRPLDPGEEIEQGVGWCSIDDPFDLELTHEKAFFNEYLNLGFRVDRWRIPTPLFRGALRAAEREHLAEHGLEKLSRPQRKNLEAIVTAQLRRTLVPAMKTIDLSWSLGQGIVRFFARSPKQAELMSELFVKTFELELVQDGPYVAAERRGLPKRVLDALPALDPSLFHTERS